MVKILAESVSTGQLLTEEFYTLGKLTRAVIGTNNYDGNTTLCMASAVGGYVTTYGKDEPMGCYGDIDAATCLFIIGSNTDAPLTHAEPKPWAYDEDATATINYTSGTTSRPKIVPLSQANLVASAQNIRATLQFTAADCGLNIMPLFHIHGLIAGAVKKRFLPGKWIRGLWRLAKIRAIGEQRAFQ